jgi:ABC-2 type transport system ATP-binding protein
VRSTQTESLDPSAAISVVGLRKLYGSKVALHDLTLTVPRGEVFGFLGPNGAGKTTAVKLITALSRPTSGEGLLLGRPISDRKTRRAIGYLPELFRFQDWLTAAELLELHCQLAGIPAAERRARIAEMLELVGLADRSRDRVGTFSKGMQQRLGLAQALIGRPRLVILDEPTSALDPIGRRDVRAIIQRLKADGTTVFLNSHLLTEIELVCDRVAFVGQGRVVREGRVDELLSAGTELHVRTESVGPELIADLGERWRVLRHAGDELVVSVGEPAEAAEVIRCLVARGASVLEVRPLRANLEQLFLELVEGGTDGRVDVRTPDAARSGA